MKLTSAQQAVVDKMAAGLRLFKYYRHPKSKTHYGVFLRDEHHPEETVNVNTFAPLVGSVVIPQLPCEQYGPFEYLLTPAGLALARKDDKRNGS